MALIIVGYNGVLLLLMRYLRWLRYPLNYLALDTVITTVVVYLTGGYHSSFFVLYVFITLGAAFQLDLVRTVMVALGIGLIYIGACYVNPAGLRSLFAQYILAAKLLLLLMVAVLCALLLEQLRREQSETARERALASRLAALNELFQRLNTSLDLNHTLRTVAEAPRTLLGADLTSIALLDQDSKHMAIAATSGVPTESLGAREQPINGAPISEILCRGQPCVLEEPAHCLIGQQTTDSVASVACVPLLLNEKPLGMLGVAYSTPKVFSEEELAFLHALGQEAALAIRNARLYEREREQVARLQALEELQESFVSAVSHELRTPLTCIKTSVDLLWATAGSLSEEQLELLRTISHHINRLETLVADLLEITRLEAGQVTLSRQPTDLRHLIGRVVGALRLLADRKGQTIRLHLPASLSLIEVDRQRIEQVLTNLISNAIKFTSKHGQIDIRVFETSDALQVCVADSGPGIPEKDQPYVFEKFYVVPDGRGLSGMGLGLYIARQMIELHGGRIWVESRVGEGSTFCFALPKTPQGVRL